MNNNEEFQKCSFLANGSTTTANGHADSAFAICGKVSSRALMCRCEGDFSAMIGCPYWKSVFVQENIVELLEQILKKCKCES